MQRNQIKAILDRVLTWPAPAQEEAAASLRAIEQEWSSDGHHASMEEPGAVDVELTDEDWKIIDERMKRRHLASDREVQALFDQYRHV